VQAHAPADDGLWRAMRDLPTKQRAAVVDRFVLDLDYRSIAERMGTTEEGRDRPSRALQYCPKDAGGIRCRISPRATGQLERVPRLRCPRLAGRQILAACLTFASFYVVPPLVVAACPNNQNSGYHYAGQHTSHVEQLVQCPSMPDFYYGWKGVNGQLTVPSSALPLANDIWDHYNGYLSAQFDHASGPDSFLQIGWMTGTIAQNPENCLAPTCLRVPEGSYRWYAENRIGTGGPGEFFIYSYGTPPLGGVTTSRVVWNPNSSCWETYLTYVYWPNYKLRDCFGEPGSGAMVASAETFSAFGPNSIVRLPVSTFGVATPSTNQTLRLQGAPGWENWDGSLVAWGTQSVDERFTDPTYFKTDLHSHYHFQAYYQP